ncbi:MAG: ATP-grasp domain-containing protein [Deltaproteobacteria bacterium]|nr:ATP-grasp domain-containing protein [Deltaproteobacteria bacterium]
MEGLLVQGTLRELAIFDKPDPLDGPYFEETIYVTPSRTDAATQNALRACAQEATRAIGLTEGPVHVEMRFNDEGAFIIELAARTMGGLCPRIIRFAGDHSLEEVVLRHACGMELPDLTPQPGASGVMMLPIPKRGVLREVRGVEKALAVDGIEDVSISVRAGQEVVPLPEGSRYLGFIFAHAETPAAAETALRKAHALLEFEIE